MPLQETDDGLQSRLGMKIWLHLRIKQDGCPRIHKMESFDDVLLFANRVRKDAGNILEIHLDFLEWLPSFWRLLRFPTFLLVDASISPQDLPNGARRTG
jgi:hypothetical protein